MEKSCQNDKNAMLQIRESLLHHQIPESYPEEIGSFEMLLSLSNPEISRKEIIAISSWCLVAKNWIQELVPFLKGKRCLELMAGKGMLTQALREEGIDVLATDSYDWYIKDETFWCDVENLDAVSAIRKYGKDRDLLILSWVPYQSTVDADIIRAIREVNPNLSILLIGELNGCCGTALLEEEGIFLPNEWIENANACFPHWYGIHDRIYLLQIPEKDFENAKNKKAAKRMFEILKEKK